MRFSNKQLKAIGALAVALAAGALGIGGASLGDVASDIARGEYSEAFDFGGNDHAGDDAERDGETHNTTFDEPVAPPSFTLADVPEYSGAPFVYVNATSANPEGTPTFTDSEISRAGRETFESYSPLDSMGRVGTAMACLGRETMPTEERGSIREVKPTGWRQNFYDFVDQEALYNRCHLIAWSLSGENANAQNLVTGTRSMNTQGMLPFEEQTLDYIRRTGKHVLYRTTPIFEGTNMLASGIHMEARSIEDGGRGVSFSIYAYNVEPGVEIDYRTGANWAE